MGNRMSLLPVAQYCGLAPKLGDQYAAGRAAAVSTVAHARAAGDPAWQEMRLRLSDEEKADLDSRIDPMPTVVKTDDGDVTLHPQAADHELTVRLDAKGRYTASDEDAVTTGHLDMGWVVDEVAYVCDIKASRYTVSEGVDSLQLHAYGIAYADKYGLDLYRVGLFFSADGEYAWGPECSLSDPLNDKPALVMAAARNEGEASMGPHCSGCYARLHCPEHTLKGISEGPLAKLSSGEITPDVAADALVWLQAAKSVCGKVEDTLKAYADSVGGIDCGDKSWRSVTVQGRKGVRAAKLKKEYPEVYAKVYEQGQPYRQFKWFKR